MRIILSFLVALALAACDTTANAPGPASEAVEGMIGQIVAVENSQRGDFINPDFKYAGASSNGNTVTVVREAQADFARNIRRFPRGEVQSVLRTYVKQQFCRSSDMQVFFAAGGRLETRIVDPSNRELARFTVNGC